MSNSKYIQTLIQFTELKSVGKSFNVFCTFGSLPNRKIQLPCNSSIPFSPHDIQCINCIFNNEDEQPKETRKLLANIIQTDKET
jgi:hypothetical protein